MSNTYKKSYKQELIDNISLGIFNCGIQSCLPEHTWGPGVRDHYLIHLVVSGKGKYTVNGNTYELKAGDIFIIKPSQLVTYTADKDDPWEYYWVGYNGTYAQKITSNLPFSDNSLSYSPSSFIICKNLIYQIYSNSGNTVNNSYAMMGNLYLLFSELSKESAEIISDNNDIQSSYVIDAIKYIQFNYSLDINVNDIAAAVGISRSHLYRVFIANLNQSPIDYLTEYRINEACSLIQNTHLSISEIATSVGFFDQFYFSRVFKKIKNVPPSKYLQSLDNKGD